MNQPNLEQKVIELLNKPVSKEYIEVLAKGNQAKLVPYDNNCRDIHYLKIKKDDKEYYFHLRRDHSYYLVINGVI